MRMWFSRSAILSALCLGVFTPSPAAPSATDKVIARMDLSKPFHLAPGATFTATQGRDVPDPIVGQGMSPGPVHLCIRIRSSAPCSPTLDDSLRIGREAGLFSDIHELYQSSILYPRGPSALPLLQLRVASIDGPADRLQAAVFVAYHPSEHRFAVIFREQFGRNNNQEVRFMACGPLKGGIVSVQSPFGPPFSYVITVNRLTPGYRYRQVLRYRSATLYGDGNPLAVIDSEMPNILRRLGLWHPGDPLPLPKSGCAHPRLVKTELWCS